MSGQKRKFVNQRLGRATMVTYVVVAKFTDQGAKAAKDSPKRAEAFKQMAKTFGVTVKDIFWTQGRYALPPKADIAITLMRSRCS
jgi:uncharacterized protein with GYD domain